MKCRPKTPALQTEPHASGGKKTFLLVDLIMVPHCCAKYQETFIYTRLNTFGSGEIVVLSYLIVNQSW